MRHYRLCLFATALTIAATLVGGCKTPGTGGERDVFTWQDALSSSPKEAQKALGEFEQCEEISPRRLRTRGWRSPRRNATWTYCVAPDTAKQHHEDYEVRAIAYLKERPVVVRLEPRSKTKVSRELLGEWDLPNLSFEHQLPPNDGKKFQAHLRYQVLEPTEVGEVRGIDIFPSVDKQALDSRFDDYHTVGFVRVYAQDMEHSIAWLIEEAGPPPAVPELVLPRLDGFLSLDDDLGDIYAEVGLESVQLGERPVYPAPPPSAPSDRRASPKFRRAELTGNDAGWLEGFEAFVATKREQAKTLRQHFDPKLHIAIDRSLPARELLQLVEVTHDARITKFALIGRNVTGTDEHFAPGRGRVVESNFTFLPGEYRSRQPSTAPGLDLTVSVQSTGFAVEAAGEVLPPLDGCPSDGATICRRDTKSDAGEMVEEARRLQEAGELGASQQKVEELLTTYDWPGLYATLTALKAKYPDETVVAIEVADPDTIVAVVAHVIRTSRYKLRAPGAKADVCAERFEDDASLRAAVPCTVDGEHRQMRELFDDVVLLESPNRVESPDRAQ